MSQHVITIRDKILCAILYTSLFVPLMTWVPLIWLVVMNVRKEHVKDFVKYHCYQSILFNMIVFFLPQLLKLLIDLLSTVLSLLVIFDSAVLMLGDFTNWFLEIYLILIKTVAIYAIVWTLRGKYTYIPPISQAVNMLLR